MRYQDASIKRFMFAHFNEKANKSIACIFFIDILLDHCVLVVRLDCRD